MFCMATKPHHDSANLALTKQITEQYRAQNLLYQKNQKNTCTIYTTTYKQCVQGLFHKSYSWVTIKVNIEVQANLVCLGAVSI